jgi:hypothetical protein
MKKMIVSNMGTMMKEVELNHPSLIYILMKNSGYIHPEFFFCNFSSSIRIIRPFFHDLSKPIQLILIE